MMTAKTQNKKTLEKYAEFLTMPSQKKSPLLTLCIGNSNHLFPDARLYRRWGDKRSIGGVS
jgi:hypothetical protein